MNLGRIAYRVRQFRKALTARPGPEGLDDASRVLSPELLVLFEHMQPSEQAHSLQVYRRLREEERSTTPDLLVAALLHDVGKSCSPLSVWERVWIVVGQTMFPQAACRWGSADGSTAGWRRPFRVAACHPTWGSELAARAGASDLTVSLIRRHQDPLPPEAMREEDQLLRRLQAADDMD